MLNVGKCNIKIVLSYIIGIINSMDISLNKRWSHKESDTTEQLNNNNSIIGIENIIDDRLMVQEDIYSY